MKAHRRLRLLRVAVASATCAAVVAGQAMAHTPIEPFSDQAPDSLLEWKYGTGVPTWLQTPVNDALDDQPDDNSLWDSFQYNNSLVPNFTKTSTGQGRIHYTAQSTSPCSGSSVWLMCARLIGFNAWEIHVRDLINTGRCDSCGPWRWKDQGYGESGNCLFDVRRNILHEGIHQVMGAQHENLGQPPTVTVMTSVSPVDGVSGWESTHVMVCDHAKEHLEYGLERNDGAIADCFEHIPNAGTNGLQTVLTLSAADTTVCVNTQVALSGPSANRQLGKL